MPDIRDIANTDETPANQPGSFVVPDVRTIADAEVVIRSLLVNQQQLWDLVRDHAKRFETLQTPWWKRVWFWIDGWPWHDLNGQQRRRPWHRGEG